MRVFGHRTGCEEDWASKALQAGVERAVAAAAAAREWSGGSPEGARRTASGRGRRGRNGRRVLHLSLSRSLSLSFSLSLSLSLAF